MGAMYTALAPRIVGSCSMATSASSKTVVLPHDVGAETTTLTRDWNTTSKHCARARADGARSSERVWRLRAARGATHLLLNRVERRRKHGAVLTVHLAQLLLRQVPICVAPRSASAAKLRAIF